MNTDNFIKKIAHKIYMRSFNDFKEKFIFHVNPNIVNKYAYPSYIEKKRKKTFLLKVIVFFNKIKTGFIMSGSWDEDAPSFCLHPTYLLMKDIYDNSYNYKETDAYKRIVSHIDKNGSYARKSVIYSSVEDVNSLFDGYIELFNSISKNGYLQALGKDNIKIMIGRNGEIIKEQCGRHRLAVAQILGVNSVPVEVTHVHPLWLNSKITESDVIVYKIKTLFL